MNEPTTPESPETGEKERLIAEIRDEVRKMPGSDRPYQEVIVYSEINEPEHETPLREGLIEDLDKLIIPGAGIRNSETTKVRVKSCDTNFPNVRKEVAYWKAGKEDEDKHPQGSVACIKYVYRSPQKAKR